MPGTSTADQTVTVRLPAGMRDRVVAATGQPFSRIVRFICTQIVQQREAEIAASGNAAPPDVRTQIMDSIGDTIAGADFDALPKGDAA